MIIRVAFNNQNWADKCIDANTDDRLFQCRRKNIVDTGFKTDHNNICQGRCWESTLCTKFYWINLKGKFGPKATGEVFFLFKDVDDSLVLWGKSKIREVIENKVYFEEFKPLTKNRWITGLQYSNLRGIGVPDWRTGTFRYIENETVKHLNEMLNEVVDYFNDPSEPFSDFEGRRKLQKHLTVERSIRLVNRFKENLVSYECTICGFDFFEKYGELGEGFIEAHHKIPVSSLHENQRIKIDDFAAVCSNCHRMLHRKNPPIGIQKLKDILKAI